MKKIVLSFFTLSVTFGVIQASSPQERLFIIAQHLLSTSEKAQLKKQPCAP